MERTRGHRWAGVLALLVLSAEGRFVGADSESSPASRGSLPVTHATTTPGSAKAFGQHPLTFIENHGQEDGKARFSLTSSGQTIWFGEDQIVFDLHRRRAGDHERLVFRQTLLGASPRPRLVASGQQPGVRHFLIGNDPSRWRTGVRGYRELRYVDVYPGIDLKLYGKGRALEQEFVVQPGAEAGQIRVVYDGVEDVRVAADGTLRIRTAWGELQESAPTLFQEIDGRRHSVAGRFETLGPRTYTFAVGAYDRTAPLTIDPTLHFSTFLVGSRDDGGEDIAIDSQGNVYVAGHTSSSDFPLAVPMRNTCTGCPLRDVAGARLKFSAAQAVIP